MHSRVITGVYLVSGMPHLLRDDLSSGYRDLAKGMQWVQEDMKLTGAKRIIYYSTQWLSVLGVSFQAGRTLAGVHVDENWHDLVPELAFDFQVDHECAERMATAAKSQGFATALIDYHGFPVDTATIVADRLLNPQSMPVSMVSSHVYADAEDTRRLGAIVSQVLRDDDCPTAVVGVSQLSGFAFTDEQDLREDRYRDEKFRRLDENLLSLWHEARHRETDELLPSYVNEARADMGLKAYAFLRGVMSELDVGAAKILAHAPINGCGAAVVKFV